jgi:hypothetical protein
VQAKTIGGLAAAVLAFVAVAGSGFLEAAAVAGSLEAVVVVGSGSLEVVVVVVGSGSLEVAAVVAAFVVAAFVVAAFSTAAAVKTAAVVQGSNLLKTEELGPEGVALVALVALVEPGSRDASLRQIWKQNYSF